MRQAWLVAALAFRCSGYELTGRIEPPVAGSVFLFGATTPFETSTTGGVDGRFRFRKLPAGTYTLTISTAARGEARKTIELSPGTVDSKGHLDIVLRIDVGRLEADGGRATEATVSATILSIPDRARREYVEARRCLSRRDSELAYSHLLRAVKIAPRFAGAWNQLGTIAYQKGQYSEAEAYFRKALDADPEAFEPLVNLGGVMLNLGQPQEAAEYNRRAVARRPGDALANSQLGFSYFEMNNLDQAERYMKIAIRLDPAQFSYPQLPLAEIYLRRGDRPSAVNALRGFLDQHPDSPQAAHIRQEIVELSR